MHFSGIYRVAVKFNSQRTNAAEPTAASVLEKSKVTLAQGLHWRMNSNFKFYAIGKYITLIRTKTAKF